MKVNYQEARHLKEGDIYSTLGNGRTIYIVKSTKFVEGSNLIIIEVQVLDFQLNTFNKIKTKKYMLNETISMRTYGQLFNRLFTGYIK